MFEFFIAIILFCDYLLILYGIIMINFGNILKNNIIYWVSRAFTLVFALVVCSLCLDSFYEIIQNVLSGDALKSYLLANGDIVKAVFRSLAFIFAFAVGIITIYLTSKTKSFCEILNSKPKIFKGFQDFIPIFVIINIIFDRGSTFNVFLNLGMISAWIFIMASKHRLQYL